MDKTLTADELEKAMSLVWDAVKPDVIVCHPSMPHLIAKEIKFWDDVKNPKIAQIFPALLKKGG